MGNINKKHLYIDYIEIPKLNKIIHLHNFHNEFSTYKDYIESLFSHKDLIDSDIYNLHEKCNNIFFMASHNIKDYKIMKSDDEFDYPKTIAITITTDDDDKITITVVNEVKIMDKYMLTDELEERHHNYFFMRGFRGYKSTISE